MAPPASVVAPVAAVVPTPLVVAEASVVAPCAIATVNWSAATTRLAIDFVRLSVGAGGVFVYVQVITSPLPGVSVFDVPEPLGRMVVEPPAVFVHEIELV